MNMPQKNGLGLGLDRVECMEPVDSVKRLLRMKHHTGLDHGKDSGHGLHADPRKYISIDPRNSLEIFRNFGMCFEKVFTVEKLEIWKSLRNKSEETQAQKAHSKVEC